MQKAIRMVLISLLFIGCQHPVNPAAIEKINGYWEIESVRFPDGTLKEYAGNTSYDFFEIKNNKGYRQKVMPQFDGSFETNTVKEQITVVFENEKAYLKYETPYAKWREELKKISEKELVLLNDEKKEYYYKKTESVNLTSDGKKAQ